MGGDGVPATDVSTGLSSEDEQAVVEALALSTVEEVAPEEAPLFGPMSEAYFDPARSSGSGSDSDEMLGFGVDAAAAMVLVTPVALEAAKSVIGYVVGELQTAFKDEAKPMIAAFVKRLLHGKEKPGATPGAKPADGAAKAEAKPPAEEPAPFTDQQLDEVRKVALRTAERMGMERDKANVVADAIVGAIVR
ncbi:MAG TPA: hypothetical protein VI277_06755 [Candidatus Limnocylindria bacterium]